MLMCLLRFRFLLFLEKKTKVELSQKILNGLAIKWTTFRPDLKFFNYNAYDVAS